MELLPQGRLEREEIPSAGEIEERFFDESSGDGGEARRRD